MRILHFLFIAIAVSCLPQEKTTQCGKNEAFDASKRKCVKTLSVSDTTNISSISPVNSYSVSPVDASVTHSITVSDPFQNGYQVKWYLTSPSGSTNLYGTGLSQTFLHTSFATGIYVLEVQLYDSTGSTNIDSRSWTINVTGYETPNVLPITATPFTTTLTSASTTINATGDNPDSVASVNYQWYVNGNAIAGQNGTFSTTSQALSFTFDPTSASSYYAGAGSYTVTLNLTENITGSLFDSFTWAIQNNSPNFASASIGSSGVLGTSTPSSGSTITSIDEEPITTGGFIDAADNLIDFCVEIDSIAGVDGLGVFVDFKIDGNDIPSATNIQFLATATSYCLSTYNDYFYDILTSSTEAHDIEAVMYDKYTGSSSLPDYNGFTEVGRFKWFLNVRPKNTAPTLIIDTANTTLPCLTTTSVSATDCSMTQDTSFDVAITVSDDDYDPLVDFNKFKVEFYLESSLVDGANNLSSSDCYHDYTDTLNATRYVCTLTINSYDLNGPIDVTGLSYSLYAQVIDADSPYEASQKVSNTINWTINTNTASNTDPVLNTFADDNGDYLGDTTQSYLSLSATPGTAVDLDGGTLNEGDLIQFHVKVDEAQRDDHIITVERCSDVACATVIVPALATTTVNSTDNTNPRPTTINHQIGEDEVTGTNLDDVYYRITVTELSTETGAPVNSDFEIITVSVNNFNPDPVFNSANFDPAQPANLVAFAGFPITLDPGSITDSSVTDGDTITYQWMLDPGTGTYEAISGATDRVLIWIPGTELDFSSQVGTSVNLKLCIGDDGVDSAGNSKTPMNGTSDDCNSVTLDTGDWVATVFSNAFSATADDGITISQFSADGEIAIWVDPTSSDPVITYTAYVTTNKQIAIEKSLVFENGTKQGSVEGIDELFTVAFDATTSASPPSDVTNLSITGDTTNDSLYISYMAPVSSVDIVHVRRIDISGGKTALQDSSKFGFEYTGLNSFTTVNGDITKAVNGNVLELTVNDVVSGSVQFNLHNGAEIFTMASEFCNPSCATTTIAATELAAAINNSSSNIIQGITASSSVNIVTIEGMEANDYLEVDIKATDIGRIMVNQTIGRWQLPIIDSSFAGADKFKISLFQGDLNVNLDDSSSYKTGILGTVASQEIDNALSPNDRVLLLMRAFSSGDTALFELDTTSTIVDSETDLFSDSDVTGLKIVAGNATNNESAYVIGVNGNNRLAYARIDEVAGDFDLTSPTVVLDLDAGFFLADTTNIGYFDLAPGTLANQLFIAVNDVAAQDAYLLQVKNATPEINCNFDDSSNASIAKCTKINTAVAEDISNLPISLSAPLENMTFGDEGATSGENQHSVVFMGFRQVDGVDDRVEQAILNIDGLTSSVDELTTQSNSHTPYVAP